MSFLIISEGGYDVNWFTELIVNDDSVEIIAFYRLYWDEYDDWPEKNKNVKKHPSYYGSDIWKESEEGRIATHYNVPLEFINSNDHGCKWYKISNPRYIFDYNQLGG